jgi:hypothetical protein
MAKLAIGVEPLAKPLELEVVMNWGRGRSPSADALQAAYNPRVHIAE